MKVLLLCLAAIATVLAIEQKTTYIITSTSEAPHCPDNASRCLTLNELIASQGYSAFQSQEVVIFQPGVHIVNETERTNLSVVDITSLTIKGDSERRDVIITCFLPFHFMFKEVENISIFNLTFSNCISNETYKQTKNQTLLFIDLMNSSILLLDSIEIKYERESTSTSIAIFMKEAVVQLTNSKLSGGSGIYIGLSASKAISTVEISNSVFYNSCIHTETFHTSTNSTNVILAGTIKNTTFARCSNNSNCWYVINFQGLKEQRINLTIVDVNIVDSSSPFLMYIKRNVFIQFKGNINFSRNQGIAYAMKSEVHFRGAQARIVNNAIMNTLGVPVYAVNACISFEDSNIQFKNNTGLFCGGIGGKDVQIIVKSNSTVDFINNKGQNGGALSLSSQSVVRFEVTEGSMAKMSFKRNEAQRGGAIFVTDVDYFSILYLNLRVSALNFEQNFGNVTLTFTNNSAQMGGNQIYGGWIDWFVGKDNVARCNPNEISNYLYFEEGITDKDIASDPLRVCLCIDKVPNCSIDKHRQTVHGRAFSVDLVAVGQRFGTVSTFVEASVFNTSVARVNRTHRVQMVQRNCTALQYNILYTDQDREVENLILEIKPSLSLRESYLKFDNNELQNHPNYSHLFQTFSIKLNVTDCPIGFKLNDGDGTCICQPELLTLHLSCNSTNYRICRNPHQWIGVTYEHTKAENSRGPGIIAHQHCPFDYCNQLPLIGLDQPDDQCAFNRVGILCGRCKGGFSVMLGTSKCKKCSNLTFNLLTIIPIYIISGLLLVVFLMILNLTVSAGTINGLIFYANIIESQHAIFFTPEISQSFLSVFISWLNLNQGIESCFYSGLDTYANMWFRFLFPLYIWLIAVVMIISSHFSTYVSKLIGKNAVQVLATLFLISFSRLFQLIIDVISFTTITYPDGYRKKVWLIDGNINFLTGKHVPLFLVAILFVLMSLVYTFILLTIQFLHKLSHYSGLFWIHKLKPFLDAYTGPYRGSHRYWTGLLLLARIALLTTFSVNQHNDPSLSLLAVVVVSFALLGWFSFTKWVYRNTFNNIMEIVNLCNLGMTAMVVFFDLHNQKRNPVAIYISTGFIFVQFVCIVLYHAQKQLLLTRYGSSIRTKFWKLNPLPLIQDHEEDPLIKPRRKNRSRSNGVTSTTVEVQIEPQHTYKSYNSCELKEP